MHANLKLERYSIGVGDRFGRQAGAQLRACAQAVAAGVVVAPVWNKSNREHLLIGSEPSATRSAADAAVQAAGWTHGYHVDADHIGLKTVERFLPHCDFFTIDVADWIGRRSEEAALHAFVSSHAELVGKLEVEGIAAPFRTTPADVSRIAGKYLEATREAGRVYRRLAEAKGPGTFITEVSMDETDTPQTPLELLVILAGLADAGVPVQTLAPKFSGRFNKGVDYVGDVARFEAEFSADVAVVGFGSRLYTLPECLKLSVHSGSDKFSLYGPMRRVLEDSGAGVHLKTAGTTWLEELNGLAEAGGEGLEIVKEIYRGAVAQVDELCEPYATVINIDRQQLPSAEEVNAWTSEQFVLALRHEPSCGAFNPHLRQLLHVAYKLAAQMGARYLDALHAAQEIVGSNVTANLFERHIKPVFLG